MAYCSVDDVKEYQGLTEATDDSLIARLIDSAQSQIDEYTARTFEASSDTTRYFDAVGKHIDGLSLLLDADLCSITTVTNGNDVEITSSQYTTKPRNETPYYAIRILSNSGVVWTYSTEWMDAIEITGKWAYSATAPNDIKQACIRLASFMYRQKDAQMYDVTAIEAGTVIAPVAIPKDVAATLRPYVRIV